MTGTQVIASADSTSVTAAATAEKTYKITSKNVTTYLHTYNDKSKTKVVVDKHLCKHTNVLIFSRR
ncbi:MAG: hypothetical protein IJT87_08720 [Ruminiclostridium sp.]|nr:hypothetical protein [Ruminiclostridium sp.]